MRLLVWKQLSAEERRLTLRRPIAGGADDLDERVARIVADVRSDGDAALRRLTRELDCVALDRFEVDESEYAHAEAHLPAAARHAIDFAIEQVERFHAAQQPPPLTLETRPGVRCERLVRPLAAVGMYVPAGSAPLPSTAVMLAVPARLAGCPLRLLCSPPRADGSIDSAVLYAARACRVSRVFKLGGAQAIAAMAYGSVSVPKVDKLFGPGNAWVTAAKQQVAADPHGAAIDLPAGPSELLVIADDGADPDWVAADLLSQAEHGPDSQVLLVSDSRRLIEETIAQVGEQLTSLPRRDVAERSLQASRAILVDDLDTALALSNDYAPEHLILNVGRPRDWLDQVQHAGSVFLGRWSPEAIGDYCSGTNHVLPTYGWARSRSGLGLADFLRFMTVQELDRPGLEQLADAAETLAALEGLEAHRRAVAIRRGPLSK